MNNKTASATWWSYRVYKTYGGGPEYEGPTEQNLEWLGFSILKFALHCNNVLKKYFKNVRFKVWFVVPNKSLVIQFLSCMNNKVNTTVFWYQIITLWHSTFWRNPAEFTILTHKQTAPASVATKATTKRNASWFSKVGKSGLFHPALACHTPDIFDKKSDTHSSFRPTDLQLVHIRIPFMGQV